MATGSKRGGDMVLGGRHIAGIFFVLVVLFGGVFTLGYVLGRSHYDTELRAAASTVVPPANGTADKPVASGSSEADSRDSGEEKESKTPPPATDWDFYHSGEPSKPAELEAKPKTVAEAKPLETAPAIPAAKSSVRHEPAKADSSKSASSLSAPLVPGGAKVLQVAALARQGDALALAQALQQKKFPAFVLNPTTDNYYRVQVGPYANAQAANIAKKRLESQGFNSIVKR